MFSLTPGTPGSRQQMPRMTRSISTPAWRGVEGLDELGVDQGVHLHDDAPVRAERGLPGDQVQEAGAQGRGATTSRRYGSSREKPVRLLNSWLRSEPISGSQVSSPRSS